MPLVPEVPGLFLFMGSSVFVLPEPEGLLLDPVGFTLVDCTFGAGGILSMSVLIVWYWLEYVCVPLQFNAFALDSIFLILFEGFGCVLIHSGGVACPAIFLKNPAAPLAL